MLVETDSPIKKRGGKKGAIQSSGTGVIKMPFAFLAKMVAFYI